MKDFAKGMSFLLIALLLQLTVVRLISIGNIKPDLVLVVLVAVALRYGAVVGIYSGLLIGVVQDVYAIDTLGANAMAKCLAGYFAGLFEERVIKVMPATKVVFLGLAFILHDAVFAVAAGTERAALGNFLLHRTLPSCIYTLLLGSLVFYFLVPPAQAET